MAVYVVRARRFALAGIVASFVLLLGGAALVQLRAAQSWASMQRTVRELREAYETRSHRREPLWGDATDGGAFAHYGRAQDAARQLRLSDYAALLKLLPHDDGQVAAEAGELRAAWQPVLAHLRAGAHSTLAWPEVKADADLDDQMVNLLDARWVANAAMFEARVLRHEGRALEAVNWSLDAATYASDLMRGSVMINQMIGNAMLAIATTGTWPDDALHASPPASLEQLAAGLERLDLSLREPLDLTHELLACARGLQNARSDEEWMPSAWRYGFSTRWMIADAFADYAATAAELGSATSWAQRDAMLELAGQEALASSNPLMPIVIPNLWAAEFSVRETIARLRMLRIAVELHRGHEAPALRDPLGSGALEVAREDRGVRIRSAGSTERRKVERFVAR